MKEGLTFDYKSLKAVDGGAASSYEIARDCVAFANMDGDLI